MAVQTTQIATQKIMASLWFDGNAEEAVTFYASLFENSQIDAVTRYSELGPGPEGTVMTMAFHLAGQAFLAINGGPQFTFTPAISFIVNCETQQEVDHLWEQLTADGGEPSQCGWLRDRYGLSWQIVPTLLGQLMQDKDPEKVKRVAEAMFSMQKLDTNVLLAAYEHK